MDSWRWWWERLVLVWASCYIGQALTLRSLEIFPDSRLGLGSIMADIELAAGVFALMSVAAPVRFRRSMLVIAAVAMAMYALMRGVFIMLLADDPSAFFGWAGYAVTQICVPIMIRHAVHEHVNSAREIASLTRQNAALSRDLEAERRDTP